MELTTSEDQLVDWLLVHINENVDWDNPFKQEEFAKLKAFVAELQKMDAEVEAYQPKWANVCERVLQTEGRRDAKLEEVRDY